MAISIRIKILLLILFLGTTVSAQVNVLNVSSATMLAQKLVGAGVVVLNPVLNCPTNASGTFQTIAGGVGLDSGIVLTTGYAATQGSVFGVNGGSSALASSNNNTSGDASLTTLAGQTTYDACSLEFDFIPKGDSIHFNYVFSSEEYINSTCGPYNDAFAFFISGPGIAGQKNMALVPNTNIPVTINSINNGVPGPGLTLANCYAMGAGSPFTTYYIDNTNGPFITHKGFTKVLEAKYAVAACSTYHLKMVIADAGNHLYDSGVFIQAGSLQSSNAFLQTIAGIDNSGQHFIVKGCTPATIKINRNIVASTAQTFHLSYSGNAVKGVDVNNLLDSITIPANASVAQYSINGLLTPKNGTKTLNIKLKSPYPCDGNNTILDSISLLVYDSLSMRLLTRDTSICIGDTIRVRVNGDNVLQYSWTPTNNVYQANQKEPILVPSQPTTYKLTATLPNSGCSNKKDSIKITARPTPKIIVNNIVACEHTPLQFNAQVTPPYAGYQYAWTGPLGFTSNQKQPIITDPSTSNSGNYSVYVRADTSQCKGVAHFDVSFVTTEPPAVTSPQFFCEQNGVQDTITSPGNNVLWYNSLQGNSSTIPPIISATNIASYVFYASIKNGNCESVKVPVIAAVKKCCDGTIFIPTAFTPNNDNKNDEWGVIPGLGYKVLEVHVYNRWGQLIFQTNSNEKWDGSFGGNMMEIGSYAYEVMVACDQTSSTTILRGMVTLIR
jgi:gliding motility-associated-like protein